MDSKNTLVINMDDLLYELYKIRQSHWITLAQSENLPFSETFFMSSHDANQDKLEKIGREYPKLEPYFKQIDAQVATDLEARISTLRPDPGKLDSIVNLSRAYNIVLLTSLSHTQLSSLKSLTELGFEPSGLFSIKDVMNGKPEPDIYLRIARAFNLKPNKLMIIESNLNGILAAYLANAKGIYLSEFMAPSQAIMEFSTIYLDHMDQLKTTLDEWFKYQNG